MPKTLLNQRENHFISAIKSRERSNKSRYQSGDKSKYQYDKKKLSIRKKSKVFVA